ncbi:MAG: hypothetical protein V1837_04980 [Candidatus Woesearchaeota archaeon]
MVEQDTKRKLAFAFQIRLFDISNPKDPVELPDKLFLSSPAQFIGPEISLGCLEVRLKKVFQGRKTFVCHAEQIKTSPALGEGESLTSPPHNLVP